MRLIVVGGGMSGLLVGYWALQKGWDVRVFEAAPFAGGWVRSHSEDGAVMEWGPNTLLANSEWFDLFQQLGISPLIADGRRLKRFIYWEGKLRSLPMGPLSLLVSQLLSFQAKKSLLVDFFQKKSAFQSDVSIARFIDHFLGREWLEKVVDPAVAGIFAGSVNELSAQACFREIWKWANEKGSVTQGMRALMSSRKDRAKMVSFDRGLQEIPEALSNALGARVHLGQSVESLERAASGWTVRTNYGKYSAERVVFATPAYKTAEIMGSMLEPYQSDILKQIKYRALHVWNVLVPTVARRSRGFGVLVPSSQQLFVRGSLWSSDIFPGRSKEGLSVMSQFIFSDGPEIMDRSALLKELMKLTGINESQILWEESRAYAKGIPQLLVGHDERIQRLQKSMPAGVYLAGNYLEGVGLTAVFKTARAVVDQLDA
jgi:oxygen-dependent protoporphyrinogen oxidase